MKIAVLADIHANLPALEAVLDDMDRWRPDRVVAAGDVINRGPQPRACLERVLERAGGGGWQFVRGNHEDFVLREGWSPHTDPPWLAEVYRHTRWTWEEVAGLIRIAGGWPDHVTVPDCGPWEVRCTHASMRSNRHGLYPDMGEDELAALIAPAPAVLVVGHTHVPFVRRVNGTLLVNAGSVGLPFDGDPRAAYARLTRGETGWEATVVRVHYDRGRTERAYAASGYQAGGGPMVRLILDELRRARPWLSRWHRVCEAKVAAGALTVEASIDTLLAARGR
jgi:predicted phosphodiesterase